MNSFLTETSKQIGEKWKIRGFSEHLSLRLHSALYTVQIQFLASSFKRVYLGFKNIKFIKKLHIYFHLIDSERLRFNFFACIWLNLLKNKITDISF